jgi:type I restriction enzyme S subunit
MSAPKLRFSEFDSEWKNITLGSLSKLVTSGSRDWAQHYSEVGSKFIRMTNLSRDRIDLLLDDMKYVDVSSNSSDGRRTSLIPGDILMSITAELGKIGLIPDGFGEAYINQHTALIRLNEGVNPRFIAQLLGTKRQNKKINKLNDAGAKAGLNLPTIKSLEIAIPESGEQKKIASFLSIVDQKIALLTKNYELLAQYKKGVMQKIFNQEIRFKDGSGKDFPDWEYLPLEEVLDYEQPGRYLVSSTKYFDDFDTPVLTAGKTFLLGYTDEINGIFTDLPVIIFDDFTTAFKFVDFPFKAKSSAMKMLKNINSDNYLRYIYEAMCRIDFQGGDEHKRYWISQYSKITIPLPHHDEQIKILEFSAGIDKKIEIIKSKLELTKQYKQGLLQQMFI